MPTNSIQPLPIGAAVLAATLIRWDGQEVQPSAPGIVTDHDETEALYTVDFGAPRHAIVCARRELKAAPREIAISILLKGICTDCADRARAMGLLPADGARS